MCLVRDEKTVGALQGVWIGLNLFYAGFVVLPQNFFSFFKAGLWINASRYVSFSLKFESSQTYILISLFCVFPSSWQALEGIIFTQFEKLSNYVEASHLSPFWFFLGCSGREPTESSCSGSMIQYATYFFGDNFSASNRGMDVGVLLGWNALALLGTWICLMKFNYVNT